MLAQSNVGAGHVVPNELEGAADSGGTNKDNELVLQLTVQLAEAINLQDRDLIAQLHETIRCIRQFDNHEYVLACLCMCVCECITKQLNLLRWILNEYTNYWIVAQIILYLSEQVLPSFDNNFLKFQPISKKFL